MSFLQEHVLVLIPVIILIVILGILIYKSPFKKGVTPQNTGNFPSQSGENLWKALNTQIVKLYEIGEYAEAGKIAHEALHAAKEIFGPNHTQVATSLNNLAALYKAQGKLLDAEPLYKEAISIWERTQGKENPSVASALNNLGDVYYSLGKYNEASGLYEKSLSIFEKTLGKDHINVANVLDNMVELYKKTGNKDKAAILEEKAKAIRGRN